MAQQRKESNPSTTGLLRQLTKAIESLPQKMKQGFESAVKAAAGKDRERFRQEPREPKRVSDIAKGVPGGPGGGGGGEKEPKGGSRFGRFLSGAGGTAAASVVSALSAPEQTTQEKTANILAVTARELAASAAIKGVLSAEKRRAAAAGEKAEDVTAEAQRAGALAGAAAQDFTRGQFRPQISDIQAAKGGFADLEQLAGLGIKVDEDLIRRRAQLNLRRAKRQREFREKVTGIVGEEAAEGPGTGDLGSALLNTAARAEQAMGKFLEGVRDTILGADEELHKASKSNS